MKFDQYQARLEPPRLVPRPGGKQAPDPVEVRARRVDALDVARLEREGGASLNLRKAQWPAAIKRIRSMTRSEWRASGAVLSELRSTDNSSEG